jgi:hypothetical protein
MAATILGPVDFFGAQLALAESNFIYFSREKKSTKITFIFTETLTILLLVDCSYIQKAQVLLSILVYICANLYIMNWYFNLKSLSADS